MELLSRKAILFVMISLILTAVIWAITRPYFFEDHIFSNLYEKQKIYLDIDWKEVPDSSQAKYYREYRLDQDSNFIGKVQDFYISGQLQWEGHISSMEPFIMEGICRWYYENGILKERGRFVNDERQGDFICYYDNGQIKYSGAYINDNAEGVFIIFDKDGTLLPQELYRSDTLQARAYNIRRMVQSIGEAQAIAAGSYYSQGQTYLQQENNDKAIQYFSHAIKIYNEFSLAIHQRGIAYYYQNKYAAAINDFEQGIQLHHPQKYHLQYLIGLSKNYQGETENALVALKKSIDMCPQNLSGTRTKALAYNRMGNILTNKKQYAEAIKYYSNAIEADPLDSHIYSNRAWAYLLSEEKSTQEQAIKDCEKSISLDSSNDQAYTFAAIYYANNNQLNNALSYSNKARVINPQNTLAQNVYRNTYYTLYPPNNEPRSNGEIDWASIALGLYDAYNTIETIKEMAEGDLWEVAKGVAVDAGINYVYKQLNGY